MPTTLKSDSTAAEEPVTEFVGGRRFEVDGISGVVSRIADIEARIRALQPPAPPARAVTTGTGATASSGATGTSFASLLSQNLTTATGSASGASAGGVAGTSRARNADGVPLDLVGYGNGKIPASALSSIGQGSHTMWAPAAQAYQQLRAAAARDGVTIKATDSYRSYEQQVDVARRKGLYSQGGLAAKPGTSEHGWGLSLDLDLDGEALTWMRAHAEEFGFSENVPRESWHWTFTG
ncbi:M15 family metallopeptidase [Kineococcus arenarius]|uniref:M15 family metallopeptidase n=1 Tax=unclassified Kineococcus TaxID=2621656 RepID=UPI003D7D82C6